MHYAKIVSILFSCSFCAELVLKWFLPVPVQLFQKAGFEIIRNTKRWDMFVAKVGALTINPGIASHYACLACHTLIV